MSLIFKCVGICDIYYCCQSIHNIHIILLFFFLIYEPSDVSLGIIPRTDDVLSYFCF